MSRWFGGPTPGAGRIPWRHRLEHEDQLKAAASKIAKQEASDEAGVDAIVVDGKRLQGDVKLEAGRNIRLVPGPSGVTIEAKHTDQSVEPGGGGDSSQSGSGSGVPVGTVVNYVGAMNGDGSIPGYPGWYLANGANGTWDLITDNPFVRFGTPASAVRAGLSGNLATLPAHVHSDGTLTTAAAAPAECNVQTVSPGGLSVNPSNHTHDVAGNTGNPTTSPTFDITPRHVVLAPIQYTGA